MKIRKYIVQISLTLIAFPSILILSCNAQKNSKEISLNSIADSVAYGIGSSIGSSMKKDGLDSLNIELLAKGLKAALKGDSLIIDQMQAQMVIQKYLSEKQSQRANLNLEIGRKFLEENKKHNGVIVLPSGLQYEVLKDGNGTLPKATDTVSVHYHGTLLDGTVFDSSIDRGEPTEFPVNAVIKGWTEALQLMKAGSKWKLFIPSELAYGDRAAGPKIQPNSVLIFEVELLSINGK